MMRTTIYPVMLASVIAFAGCKKEGPGKITVFLKDSPVAYQQVNVEIVGVKAHLDNGDAWIDLPTNNGTYDLLTLQHIDTTICNTSVIPAGKITQLRLLLGTNNTVMADSVLYPLDLTGGSAINIVMPGGIDVPPQTTITVLLDFGANESVLNLGNSTYQLKPVVKVVQ